ncbi:glutamate/tyrosine decarboxylase-like PLP-dependent enzyme [Amycolatopsis bartoniae]|uniref:Aspartate aminotransferase family protein n=1 Tax=Amycolatopsis bartoniae TaxID=941986 RepID=A0A8H9IRW2_9PSEU|nr:aminotransferase class V-fold PLP-dependent enzyme [Amycolatopsis bartoniae]MBB2936898.1 glutamate/tyrosine decarboxylase-like PLP-dependent enzyme [Amycolatopsis bartoniae]TVT07267.1 aspartate aminotransferase family protein [Amycolatopsis bartoniae]GHF51023.1 aspartate aminotransferase family protein [Amycolatopsis bartoniae]
MTDVLAELRALRAGDLPTHGGRTLAYVYDSGLAGLDELAGEAHALASSANALDPTAFPSLLKLENDLVAAAARLLGGGAGTVTSGGTESCLLAVLAARGDAPEPNMVLPSTAHAAFHKAAHLFGVRPVVVPADPRTFRADAGAMAAAIDESTVLVVASAPSYAHGVLDPVAEIAATAAARGVRMHVDACIGGWVLPYFRRLGRDVPEFGFAVDGVTSVSVDLHKYAYCPKGVSVLLHRDAGLRRGHYFASARWPGYTMLNTTLQSTRSGGPLAAAWAVLRKIGDEGYLRLAEETLTAVTRIRDGVEGIDGLRVLGEPDSTLLALAAATDEFDLFTVADEMRERGWYVQPQFAHESSPVNLHLTVTAANRGSEDEFLADLAASVAAARAAGPVRVDPDVAAFVAALDPDTLTAEQFAGLLTAAGLTGGGAPPARMAEINTLLAAAPPALRERLLLEFLGALYRP